MPLPTLLLMTSIEVFTDWVVIGLLLGRVMAIHNCPSQADTFPVVSGLAFLHALSISLVILFTFVHEYLFHMGYLFCSVQGILFVIIHLVLC